MDKPFIIATIAALGAILLTLAGCASGTSSASHNNVSYDFGSGSVETNGKTLTIKLEGNPTTGYEWVDAINGTALTQVSADYASNEKKRNVSGAGGVYTYTYEGCEAGRTVIDFSYRRSWESDNAADTLEITTQTDEQGNITGTSVASEDALLDASYGSAVVSSDGFSRIELTTYESSSIGNKYVAEKTASGVRLSQYETVIGDENYNQLVKQTDGDYIPYAQLASICKESDVRSWDGYNKSDSNVLDGWSFALDATFSDGQTVHASGSNAAPEGYTDFRDAFIGLFSSSNTVQNAASPKSGT